MYHLIRREEFELGPGPPDRSSGLARALLIGGHTGAVHTGLALAELADGHVDSHVHSFETTFYVLSGEPVLYLEGRGVQLVPGACGVVPVGTEHAWRSEEPSRFLEMYSPRPRDGAPPPDTFWLGPAPDAEPEPLDLRDPRNRHFFRLGDG